MSPQHIRIAELAKEDRARKFSSIAHLLTVEALQEAFEALRTDASAGVDGVTYTEYAKEVGQNLEKLHDRLKQGKYRAQPLRRVYIPKEDGRQRPISIPSLEDKIVQKAAADLLHAIYEQDFLDCSYGFRPGRGPHDALDEVARVLNTRSVSTVLEADITGYFDAIVRSALMEMIEQKARKKLPAGKPVAPRVAPNVVDLVAVLQESLQKVGTRKAPEKTASRVRSTNALVKQKRRPAGA